VYSLNVPVPGRVAALADRVAADLTAGAGGGLDDGPRVRDEHTLVCKRLPDESGHRLDSRVRDALGSVPAFEARVTGVDHFERAASGPSPVVYLAVEAPELHRLHDRLAETFDPVAGVEGADYVPHVTVARGGRVADAERVRGPVDPVGWTVTELVLYDATRGLPAGTLSLPR
jgi:2'-5' RNA ligase